MSIRTPDAVSQVRYGRQTCARTMEWLPHASDVITIASGVQYLFTIPTFPGDTFARATFCTDSTTSQTTNASSHLFFTLYDKAETVLVEGTTAATYARKAVSADDGASWSWSASAPKTLDFTSEYLIVDAVANLYAVGLLAVYSGGSLKLKGITLDAFVAYGRGHDGQNGGTSGFPYGMKARTIIHNTTSLTASPSTVTPDNSATDRNLLAWGLAGNYPI